MIHLALAIILLPVVICIKGILQLNSTTLTKARVEFPQLVVYFYSENCQYCTEFSRIYQVVAAKSFLSDNSENIKFAQMSFNNLAAHESFKQYGIESVPDLRVFSEGIDSNARYESLFYDETSVKRIQTWINRATNPGFFREVGNLYLDTQDQLNCLNQKCERLIFRCSDSDLINTFISQALYYRLLDVSFACLRGDRISPNSIFYENIHAKKEQKGCLAKNIDESTNIISQTCIKSILNMRRSEVQHWRYDHLQQIYTNNRTIFVLFVANESNSRKMLKQFIQIRQKWSQQKNLQTNLLPIFSLGDKDYDTQEVLRLKRFIGGYQNNGLDYPYPLLAYLKLQDNTLMKILYESRYPTYTPSDIPMEQWMNNMINNKKAEVHYRNIKSKKNEKQEQIMNGLQYLYESALEDKRIVYMNLYELVYLLKFQQNGLDFQEKIDNRFMFILYISKTSHEMATLLSSAKNWWKEAKIDHYFYYLDYFENDAPPGITIENFPALLIYQKGKLLQQIEGVDEKSIEKTIKLKTGSTQ